VFESDEPRGLQKRCTNISNWLGPVKFVEKFCESENAHNMVQDTWLATGQGAKSFDLHLGSKNS
jgi:hypothetical protein